MRDQRVVRCTYYLESEIEPARAAAVLAGEQSSGTFVSVPGESRGAARTARRPGRGRAAPGPPQPVAAVADQAGEGDAARVVVEWPMENIGTDLATLQTTIAGNLFELQELFACRVLDLQLPAEFIAAHPGPAFGVPGTRRLIGDVTGAMIGTIVKPNVGLSEEQFRSVVRELAHASIDLIKDDELMTDPGYLPLERRVAVATEEIRAAEQVTGHPTMYAFNITGDLAGLRRRHDLVVEAGGRCVMLNVPVMGLPALAWLREFAAGPDPRPPGRPGRLDALTRARDVLPGVAAARPPRRRRPPPRQRAGQQVLRDRRRGRGERRAACSNRSATPSTPVPTLSSGQNVTTAAPTYAAVRSTDLLMLAGGGVAAHPDGPAAGVRSLRDAWTAAIDGVPLQRAAAARGRHR